MTQTLQSGRPVARPYALPASFAAPRPAASRPLAVVPTVPVEAKEAGAAPIVEAVAMSTVDQMIAAVEQAAARIADLLEKQSAHEREIADLQQRHAALQENKDLAEEAASRHKARASEALLKVERLQAQSQVQHDEQERLKASVDALLSMFGARDPSLAAS